MDVCVDDYVDDYVDVYVDAYVDDYVDVYVVVIAVASSSHQSPSLGVSLFRSALSMTILLSVWSVKYCCGSGSTNKLFCRCFFH